MIRITKPGTCLNWLLFLHHLTLLPSATKLRRLCFYRCLSVHRGGSAPGGVSAPGRGAWSRGAWSRGCMVWGVPGPGGCLVMGGVCSLGRVWLLPGGGIPACTEAEPPGRDGYCCGRYASHWNAFLLTYMIQLELIEHDFTRTLKSQIYNECPT